MQHIRRPAAGLLLAAMLLLSGCAPDEVKQEAKARKEAYQQAFADKVKAAYGEDAGLRKVECPVESKSGSVSPSVTYYASDHLTGQLIIDNARFEAEYDPQTDTLRDSVHTKAIYMTLVDALPIDHDQICAVEVTDNAFMIPLFPSDADTFEKAMTPDNSVCLLVNVITKEDLSAYRDTDFNTIPEVAKLSQNSCYSRITLISVENTNQLSALTGKLNDLEFYEQGHPTVYDSITRKYQDAYSYFNIRHVIRLSQTQDHMPYRQLFCE